MQTGLESLYPDNSRTSMNMHYQSEDTQEFGTLCLRKGMLLDDLLRQYAQKFPIECSGFLTSVREINQNLHRPGGMSKEGIVMAIGKLPQALFYALEFLDPEFFMDGGAKFRSFLRAYPRFAVGDHSRKLTSGARI